MSPDFKGRRKFLSGNGKLRFWTAALTSQPDVERARLLAQVTAAVQAGQD